MKFSVIAEIRTDYFSMDIITNEISFNLIKIHHLKSF